MLKTVFKCSFSIPQFMEMSTCWQKRTGRQRMSFLISRDSSLQLLPEIQRRPSHTLGLMLSEQQGSLKWLISKLGFFFMCTLLIIFVSIFTFVPCSYQNTGQEISRNHYQSSVEAEKVDDSLWHSHILIYPRKDYKQPCILIISIYTHIYFIYPHILLYTIYIYIISVQSYHPLTRMDITLQILYIILSFKLNIV